MDELEGFSRIMPLFGAWCASGRDPQLTLPGNKSISLPKEFERGLLAGTDPRSRSYWGDMPGKSNQRIVEAADIALALWLFRDTVWNSLPPDRRDQVVSWLALVDSCPGLDNNWHLFFVLIDRVLATLGYPGRISSAKAHYERIKEFHLGDGWFKDGPNGRVDFYNAWGFHYALDWIDKIDPDWDPEFIRDSLRKFLSGYKFLIGPEGIPIMGRSLCYRMAAPAPLVFGCERHSDIVSAGEARRALDTVWRYFIRHGALRHGGITQGYWDADPRLLDPYSGPASSLWSLRSLVASFYQPPENSFWRQSAERLPVESGDYELMLDGAQWRVRGYKSKRRIVVEVLNNPIDDAPELEPVRRRQTLRRIAEGKWLGPRNDEAKYGRRYYCSDKPFCV